jgi:antitoxin Phd
LNQHSRVWSLQEAKAKFSEVIRRAQTEGRQTVTVHGKAAVHIVPVSGREGDEDTPTVDEMLAAIRACPVKNFKVPRVRTYGRFRDVEL